MGTTYRAQSAALQSVQEAVKGIEVATQTVRHVFETLKITPIDEIYRPKLSIGALVANQGGEFAVRRGTEWEINGPVIVDQFHTYLSMVVNGVPVCVGAAPNCVWTATRSPVVDPALKSRSFTAMLTDGTTPMYQKFLYSMAQKLEVQGSENSPITFALSGFGRRLLTGAWTGAIALPTMDMPGMAFSTVYIDPVASWPTPATAVVAAVLGWKYTIETGVRPFSTADGRTDLDFSTDEINPADAKISAEITLLAKAGGIWATEKTAAEAGTARMVSILSTITAARSLQFIGYMKYSAGSLFPDGEKDGLQTVNLKLEGSTDLTNFLIMVCKNAIATLT